MLDSANDDRPTGKEEEPRAADAGWLVGGEVAKPKTPHVPDGPVVSSGDGYDVVGHDRDEPDDAGGVPVPPVPEPVVRPTKAASKPDASRSAESKPSAQVDQVWTRGAEWGPDLVRLAGAGLGVLFLLYLAFSAGSFSLAFFFFLAGGAAMLALSYPVMITLERPVRIVPEQAVKDFFAALTHALPHYRRMWLLLSSAGRTSPHFTTFEGFRAYWNEKLSALAGPDAGRLNRLTFQVAEFQSDQSSGKTAIDVTFRLNVARQDRPDSPIASYPMAIGLIKGPDRMWYLNSGTLPGGRG